ncbi:MAG: hypothetical protein WCK15_13410 [Pirellula sp.]
MALSTFSVRNHRSDFHTSVLDRLFFATRLVPDHSNAKGVLAAQVLPIFAIAPARRFGIQKGTRKAAHSLAGKISQLDFIGTRPY